LSIYVSSIKVKDHDEQRRRHPGPFSFGADIIRSVNAKDGTMLAMINRTIIYIKGDTQQPRKGRL
jgi:hypothetical protein